MDRLIIVYNAHSGKINPLPDLGHKLFSPKSFPCSLCGLTHGTFNKHKAWKQFISESEIEMEFYHIDEFEKKFKDIISNIL